MKTRKFLSVCCAKKERVYWSHPLPKKRGPMTRIVDWQNWKVLKTDFRDFRNSPLRQTIYKWRQYQTLATLQKKCGKIWRCHYNWLTSVLMNLQHVKHKTNRLPMARLNKESHYLHAWSLLKTTLTLHSSIRLNYLEKTCRTTCGVKKAHWIWPWKHHPIFGEGKIMMSTECKKYELPWGWHTFFTVKGQLNRF